MAEQTVPIDVNALLKEMDELKKDKANLECKLDRIIHHESKQKYYEKNKEQIMKKSRRPTVAHYCKSHLHICRPSVSRNQSSL